MAFCEHCGKVKKLEELGTQSDTLDYTSRNVSMRADQDSVGQKLALDFYNNINSLQKYFEMKKSFTHSDLAHVSQLVTSAAKIWSIFSGSMDASSGEFKREAKSINAMFNAILQSFQKLKGMME